MDSAHHAGGRDAWSALGRCLRQGLRSALFRRPAFDAPPPSWPVLGALLALQLGLTVAAQRLAISGPAEFRPWALQYGWYGTLVSLALCGFVAERAHGLPPRPDLRALFGVVLGQQMCFLLLAQGLFLPFYRDPGLWRALPEGVAWAAWWGVVGWSTAAWLTLLLRWLPRRSLARAAVLLVGLGLVGVEASYRPPPLWSPPYDETAVQPPTLDEAVVAAQPRLLDAALARLAPQRPGVVDLYSLTFAPYAGEGVFLRESALVDGVMRSRFDAEGRSLQLVNHPETGRLLPWATAGHLQQAIAAVGRRMDPHEDVLFLHLTSHGGRDGALAMDMEPLALAPVDAARLRGWLDAAGIRNAVISVSACYSGSWIAPLANDDTLVMTAADARHTSYGCGRGSPLTYFGRAMFDEALRETLSFEAAHAAARDVIARREQEADKSDGYSNPQIAVGRRIQQRLKLLESRLPTIARNSGGGLK